MRVAYPYRTVGARIRFRLSSQSLRVTPPWLVVGGGLADIPKKNHGYEKNKEDLIDRSRFQCKTGAAMLKIVEHRSLPIVVFCSHKPRTFPRIAHT